MKHILLFTAALGVAASFAQSDNLRLDTPLLGKTETGLDSSISPSPRRQLGYEGTPIATKKADEPNKKKPKGQTEITSLEVTFDQNGPVAVFLGEVVVKDPEFTVNCDRLTAYLKKNKPEGKNPPDGKTPPAKPAANPPPANPPPANPSPGKPPGPEEKGGGLERAVADANPGNIVVVTQDKVEADGSISKNIGRGRRITYDAGSGDIVLTGMPTIQQGGKQFVATDERTVMYLNRNGHAKIDGPSKTILKDLSAEDAR